MADTTTTATVATTATTVTAPSRPGAGTTGPQWLSLTLVNIGTTVIHVALDGVAAVAEADETLALMPNGGGASGVPYLGSFSAIAVTSSSKLQVIGSDAPSWR